ncbi:hypothetical protein TNCV_4879531, partial [Trichonephila clavipes]
AGSTGIGKGTTFVMARFKIPVEVFTLTTLTRPSLPGNTSRIRPIGQSRAWCWDPLKERADSPSEIERVSTWNDRTKNPKQYKVQEKDEIAQFVKKCPGVKGLRSLGSEESGDKGREFRTVSICAINVVNSSKFKIVDFATLNKMRFMDLMFASHNPPKWGEAGGMKFHSIPSSALNS